MTRLGMWVWGSKTTEGRYYFHCIIIKHTHYQHDFLVVDTDLDHLDQENEDLSNSTVKLISPNHLLYYNFGEGPDST